MSIKTTQRITRQQALQILAEDIPQLPNDTLAHLLDTIANSEQSRTISMFDNFIVSDVSVQYEPPKKAEFDSWAEQAERWRVRGLK
jgi:hypothetical protein